MVTKLDRIFAKNLRAVMQQKGISGYELADKAGMARTHLGYVRNSKMGLTTYTIERICNALGVEPAAMLEE